MRLLYSLFINLYAFIIRVASLFNNKAKLFLDGRKNIFTYIDNNIYNKSHKIIWVHCASLGEFEQSRPLIEKLKIQHSEYKILLTFFSPSGYEIRKNYDKADWVMYLPMDTYSNAQQFIEKVKPEMAIFVKYEFWFNYLKALSDNNIKTYFISVILRNNHYFFKWYGKWFLNQLEGVNHFFVQDENTLNLFIANNITQVSLTGDTRFDRVYEIAQQAKSFPLVENFKANDLLMVVGSSWPADEEVLKSFYNLYNSKKLPKLKLLIAPHNLTEANLMHIEGLFEKTIRYSKVSTDLEAFDVLIVDNVGMLSSLYKYADYTYIGGGFGTAVHNTLEAAVFGMPIFFGPNHQKFKEIQDLLTLGCAHEINSAEDIFKYIDNYISKKDLYFQSSSTTKEFVISGVGSTDKILKNINLL